MKGHKYRHYKGGRYRVLCVAIHTESKEELVIDAFLACTLEEFNGEVKKDNGLTVKRFERIYDKHLNMGMEHNASV